MAKLNKYVQAFKAGFQEVLVYRTNFVLWRVGTLLRLFVLYFLWTTVFLKEKEIFGYTHEMMITYVLGSSIIHSFVLSSETYEVAGEIHQGRLTNYLLRPISYLGYWFSKDWADKLFNLLLTIIEITLIVVLLKPPLFIQTNPTTLLITLFVASLGILLFFYISFLLSLIAFWVQEVWAPRFLFMVVVEFLSGGTFPLDILPASLFNLLNFLPFPYLIFFPLKIYLGQVSTLQVVQGISILIFWTAAIFLVIQYAWRRGLYSYKAEGR